MQEAKQRRGEEQRSDHSVVTVCVITFKLVARESFCVRSLTALWPCAAAANTLVMYERSLSVL